MSRFADSIPDSHVPRLRADPPTRGRWRLSGDGGDELFAGYNRYLWAERLWRKIRLAPPPLRRAAAATIRAVPMTAWDRIFRRPVGNSTDPATRGTSSTSSHTCSEWSGPTSSTWVS